MECSLEQEISWWRLFPALCRAQKFITVLKKTWHWTLSCVCLIQSTSSTTIFITHILILSSHQLLGLSLTSFLTGIPTKILQAFLRSRPFHQPWLYRHYNVCQKKYKLWISSLCNFFIMSITWSILSLDVFFSNLFSKTLSLYFSNRMRSRLLIHIKQQVTFQFSIF